MKVSILMAVSAAAMLAACATTSAAPTAADIHKSALILDPHADLPSPYDWKSGGKVAVPQIVSDQVSPERLIAGEYDAVTLSVFVPQTERNADTYKLAREEADLKLDYIDTLVAGAPDRFGKALTAGDVRRIESEGKIAILVSLLNAFPLGPDASTLEHFHDRGVRIIGLTHAGNNAFADSSRPQARDTVGENGGLSEAGKELIRKANAAGILLDVSQISDAAFDQALDLAKAPVIDSHSGVFSKAPGPRSLTDAKLDRIKANGGVLAIVAFSVYLVPTPPDVAEQLAAIQKKYGAVNGYENLTIAERTALSAERDAIRPKASVSDFVDSIDYAVQRIGIDHVAISSDFNHGGGVTGFADASEAANVTEELVKRGYSSTDIAKLWSGNVLRVLEAAQAAADKG